MAVLFTLTAFLSAALLFLVQPMTAKMILPSFGGAPMVWNASMVFFQAALLAGYAFAHFSTKALGPKRQPAIHIPLLLLSLLFLPMALQKGYNPSASNLPTALALLTLLAAMVGVPFFMVSTGAPILQRWFGATGHPQAKDPYFMYAASNFGSLLGLLAYPFWIEPNLRLGDQAKYWTWGYVGLICLVALCAVAMVFSKSPSSEVSTDAEKPLKGAAAIEKGITWKRRLRWVALAAIPSSLMLGVTNYLTTNISPVPLLWVVPLSIYLLTYVAAFARWRPIPTSVVGRIAAIAIAPLAITIAMESNEYIVQIGSFHLIAFGLAALYCHMSLADDRPNVSHLTEFYLWLSVGGVLGGMFNTLVAPLVFSTLAEYPLAYVALLALMPLSKDRKPLGVWDVVYPVAVACVTFAAVRYVSRHYSWPEWQQTGLQMGLPCILAFIAIDRPIRYALSLGAFFVVIAWLHPNISGRVVYTGRSFFGVYRVVDYGNLQWRELLHGNTVHGRQFLDARKTEPLTYYSKPGPIGNLIQREQALGNLHDFALVGLGVGSLASYGKSGQSMTFFEIDPLIENIATSPKYFSFVSDSKANVEIVLGDARLSMQESPNSSYDLIVLDAFSSDAIPVHLLTLEAFQMYISKLRPHGFLAVHISNRFLDLEKPVSRAARDLELYGIEWPQDVPLWERGNGFNSSDWIVLSRSREVLEALKTVEAGWYEIDTSIEGYAWSDDFSDIVGAFKQD